MFQKCIKCLLVQYPKSKQSSKSGKQTLLQLKINTNRTVQVWSTVLTLMIFSTVVGETLHDFVHKIPQSFVHVCNFVSVMQLLFKCKMNAMLIVHYLVLMHYAPETFKM